MVIALWIVVGILLLAHLLLPLVIWKHQWVPCRFVLEPADLTSFFAERSAAYLANDQQLRALGFVPVAASAMQTGGVTNRFALYRLPGDDCVVTLMSLQSVQGEQLMCDFTQSHANGVSLSVVNTPIPDVYPSWHRFQKALFPGEQDLKELFRCFLAVRRNRGLAGPVALPEGQELDYLARYLNDQHAHLVEKGLFARECVDGRRGTTLYGIYRMTWKLLWPGKPILMRLARRRAKAWVEAA